MESLYTNLFGLKIYYEIHGSGKEIVLLHGWEASIDAFKPVIDYFSNTFKVIALDLPGFGKSDLPKNAWGIDNYASLVKEFLDKMFISYPILIGHSFGGRIIISLVANGGIKAHKIVLIDSAGIKPKRKIRYYVKVYTFKAIKNLLQMPFLKYKTDNVIERARNIFGSGDYKNTSGVLRETMVKVVNEDLKGLLPKINAPTLLIWGENDKVTPISDGKQMEKLIPDAGLVVLKDAGHFSYLEKQNEFNLIVGHFLRNDAVR